MHEGPAALDAAAYTRLYDAEYPRLVEYARTLTGNPWTAGDLVAEAHFRVWRRLRAGHPIGADAVPAELASAVRGLSAAAAGWGPPQRASYLEPLVTVLGELPQRWVTALWLAEVDGLPPETVARRTGASPDGAATLVERARESLRREFLRAQPGAPVSAACGACWEGMPAHVQGTDSPHQAERIAVHIDGCQDCRARMEELVAADDRLPALTGPALLELLDRGEAQWLVPLAAAGAWAASAAARTVPLGGALGGALGGGARDGGTRVGGAHAAAASGPIVSTRRSVHHLVRGQVRQAGPVAATVAGAGVLLVAGAAVAAGLALTDGGPARAEQPAAASAPSLPRGSGPSSEARESSGSSGTPGTSSTSGAASRQPEGARSDAADEASRGRPSSGVPSGHSPSDVPSSAVSPSRSVPSSSSSPSSRPTSTVSPSPSASGKPSDPSSPSSPSSPSPTQDPTDGGTAEPSGTPGQPEEPSGRPTSDTPSETPSETPGEGATPTARPTASSADTSEDCVSLLVKVCVNDGR